MHLIHLSVGEEAVEVGVCAQLADKDDITNTLPGHGIAKGVKIEGMVAELMGKRKDCARAAPGTSPTWTRECSAPTVSAPWP